MEGESIGCLPSNEKHTSNLKKEEKMKTTEQSKQK
jgi:hypothetical protein